LKEVTVKARCIGVLLVVLSAVAAGAAPPVDLAPSEHRRPRTEVEWEVGEIVADIAEMVTFAKAGPLDPTLRVEVTDLQPSPKGLWVALRTSGTKKIPVIEIVSSELAVSPEPYRELATLLLAQSDLRAKAGASSDGPALLARLSDFTVTRIQAENARVSEWLTREPLSAAAHEEAALVLAAFGLKENAGTDFSDVRNACTKSCAHLALASALRGGNPPGVAGRWAQETIYALYGDQARVAADLRVWRNLGKPSAGEEAWLNALALYSTGDWRILRDPFTASLLERVMHFRALSWRVGDSVALDFLQKRTRSRWRTGDGSQ
jgi:hypothetical protein